MQCFSFCNLIRNWCTYANERKNVNKYPTMYFSIKDYSALNLGPTTSKLQCYSEFIINIIANRFCFLLLFRILFYISKFYKFQRTFFSRTTIQRMLLVSPSLNKGYYYCYCYCYCYGHCNFIVIVTLITSTFISLKF